MILNGRRVIDTEVDGIDTNDYPDFCDAYISFGRWEDTGKELTDTELEVLNDQCGDQVYDRVMEVLL
jgi:hypothetical protein